MRRRPYVIGILLTTVSSLVSGHREYLRNLPNADKVACPPGRNCWDGPCGGFGHQDCTNGEINEFGHEFHGEGKRAASNVPKPITILGKQPTAGSNIWSTSLCLADSDGDGKTNGDELGDPCCTWNFGDIPDVTTDITSPGDRSSVTKRPSCLYGVPLSPVVRFTPGQRKVLLNWQVPNNTCLCSISVSYVVGTETKTVLIPRAQKEFVFGGLAPSTIINFNITASNLMSVSGSNFDASGAKSVVAAITLGTANNIDTLAVSTPLARKPAGTMTAGDGVPLHIISIAVTIFVGLFGPILIYWLADPHSAIRNAVHHKYIVRYVPENFLLRIYIPQLWNMSYGQLSICALLLATMALWFVWALRYFDSIPHPFGAAVPWARALGYACFVPMSLIMLPVTKHSIWVRVMGVPYDRALVFHRLLGYCVILMAVVHGIAMIVAYKVNSFPGLEVVFSFSALELNGLPGFMVLLFLIVMMIGASPYVRRKWYIVFYYTHWLFVPTVGLTAIHVGGYYPLIFMMAPAVVFWVVDKLLLLGDAFFRPATVRYAYTRDDAGGQYLRLVMKKKNFDFKGGDYIYLLIPEISIIPHPFSIASIPPRAAKPVVRPPKDAVSSIIACGIEMFRNRGNGKLVSAPSSIKSATTTPLAKSPQLSGAGGETDYTSFMPDMASSFENSVFSESATTSLPPPISRRKIENPASFGSPTPSNLDSLKDGNPLSLVNPTIPEGAEGSMASSARSKSTVRRNTRGSMSVPAGGLPLSAIEENARGQARADRPPMPSRYLLDIQDDSGETEFSIIARNTLAEHFTSRLHGWGLEGNLKQNKVYVLGPFGNTSMKLPTYDLVLLVGGGVGITPMVSLFGDKWNDHQQVQLIWVCRSFVLIEEVYETLERAAMARPDKSVAEIYFTPKRGMPTDLNSRYVTIQKGRPDVSALVQEAIMQHVQGARGRQISVAVCGCGPPSLISSLQKIAKGLRIQNCRIHFYQDTFEL